MSRKITLSVKRSKFRSDDPLAEQMNEEFRRVRPIVLKRDNNRCVYCEFYAEKYQEVHHLDNDHANNDPDNLVVTCSLCHMCHHISFAGLKEMGTLIYLEPELGITQADVNALTRTIWFAQDSKNQEVNSIAVELYFRLFFRSTIIKNSLGDANPSCLGDFLLSLDEDAYRDRADKIRGVYFLPAKEGFVKQYRYWKESYRGALPRDWKRSAVHNVLNWYQIENEINGITSKQAIRKMLES